MNLLLRDFNNGYLNTETPAWSPIVRVFGIIRADEYMRGPGRDFDYCTVPKYGEILRDIGYFSPTLSSSHGCKICSCIDSARDSMK